MKLDGGLLSKRGGSSGAFSRGFTAAPKPTVAPVMASQPGTYGGPPGSFITKSRGCPPGYMPSPLSRGEVRCIPRVAAPVRQPARAPAPVRTAPPVTVSPTITVSPTMQQSFTPQFSPVMTMQQASPGATAAAAPVQAAAPAQTAVPATLPRAPSQPVPFQPMPSIPEATIPAVAPAPSGGGYADWPQSPELDRAIDAEREKPLPLGMIAAAAAVGLFLFTRKSPQGR